MAKLITLSEAAKALGLSIRKVRRDALTGHFAPALVRFGRAVRIRESELREWIEAGCPHRDAWDPSHGDRGDV